MMGLLEKIRSHFVVAIIRGGKEEEMLPVVQAMYEGGIRVLEMTISTPHAIDSIKSIKAAMPDDLIIGAGTVLDPETARLTILAGAQFILSPTVNQETIRMTRRYGVISIPGALTPTEILTAYEYGADIIKVFPAGMFGPKYLKDILAPLPQVPLMPTGGVNVSNIGDYVRVGAAGAGIGNALFDAKREMSEQYLMEIKERSAQFVEEVRKARAE